MRAHTLWARAARMCPSFMHAHTNTFARAQAGRGERKGREGDRMDGIGLRRGLPCSIDQVVG
eukprot:366555-Chlamydomonas_euryale.AAC.13